jgi:Leucine-rich repeat (LRR) protein
VFSSAKDLAYLDLSVNPIRKIINTDKNWSLNNLTTLYISCINVASLDTVELISFFPNLETLRFSSNELDQLKPNQLVGFKKLRTLTFSVNNQKSLTAKLFNGVQDSLSTLNIVSSGIKSIDYDALDRLSSLSTVDLTNNSLSAIIGLRIPSSLKALILNKNHLSSFRPISKFLSSINLDLLDLSENRFSSFSTINFNVLSKLTKLSLSSNPIVSPTLVFSQIRQAKALTRLELRDLGISIISSDAFQNQPNLIFLDLVSNKINSISSGAFSKLPNIVNIILASNSLTKINNDTFSGLDKLTEINLSNNTIVKLDSTSFANLPSLEALVLSSNNITSIDRSMISGSNNIKYISLANNKISSIAAGTFNNLINLALIDLSANLLTDLDSNMFAGCTNLTSIFIANNAISSDVLQKLCPTSQCTVYS